MGGSALNTFIPGGGLNRDIRHAGIRSDSFLGGGRTSVPVMAILLGVVFSILATYSTVLGQVALAPLGSLSETQNLRVCSVPIETESAV